MKILWLVNIIMPELAINLNRSVSVFGGWLTGAMKAVKESGNELVICTTEPDTKDQGKYDINGVRYYICARDGIASMREDFREILNTEKPDVVHVYGTEFEHSLAMTQVSDKRITVVTIQGALVYYKENVFAGLPEKSCKDNIIHKLMRMLNKGGKSIQLQKNSYDNRALAEKAILESIKYINGGSEWGNAVGLSINPDAKTFDCGLILRDSFYCDERWSAETCEKHSIYILHSYPIKGFHKFLEALKIVVKKYPDTKVYVVANRISYRHYGRLKNAIMNVAPDYDWIVQQIIEENNLQEYIISVGYISETEVKERMLKSNVFVSASSIENQSTTLGEAMILGVPSVASCVGAIQEMIDDGVDGFIYPFNEPYMLADKIIRVFEDEELAKQFSQKGHEHAARTYNRETNCRRLLEMYDTIVNNVEENTNDF